jgi:hypothetical protein
MSLGLATVAVASWPLENNLGWGSRFIDRWQTVSTGPSTTPEFRDDISFFLKKDVRVYDLLIVTVVNPEALRDLRRVRGAKPKNAIVPRPLQVRTRRSPFIGSCQLISDYLQCQCFSASAAAGVAQGKKESNDQVRPEERG